MQKRKKKTRYQRGNCDERGRLASMNRHRCALHDHRFYPYFLLRFITFIFLSPVFQLTIYAAAVELIIRINRRWRERILKGQSNAFLSERQTICQTILKNSISSFICCLLNRKESFLLSQFNKNNPTERKLIHERMEWKQFFSR